MKRILLAITAYLACPGLYAAEAPPVGAKTAVILGLQKDLGAPAKAPAPAKVDETLAAIGAILDKPGISPSDALVAIRAAVGAPSRPPADDDAQVLKLIRQRVDALARTAPEEAAKMIAWPRKSGHPDPHVLEHSHMYFGLHGMLFEAQIAPNIFFFDNRERTAEGSVVDVGIYSTELGHSRWAVSWSFTPMIRLRNLSDTSGPIKTLSWMPKTDVQAIRLHRDAKERATMLTLHGTVGHHSNGQDECTYEPGILDREDLCPVPVRVQDVTLNYPNGSFSTNYIRLGVVRKRIHLHQPATYSNALVTSTYSFGLYAETHPHWLKVGGTLPPVLAELYGKNRLRAVGEVESRVGSREVGAGGFFKGSVRLTGWLDYIDKIPPGLPATSTSRPDAPLNALYQPHDGSSRWRFGFEGAWNPDWLRGWGLELRYDHGQDYYNLLYARDIHWFQAGIVFDAAEFQPFKKR